MSVHEGQEHISVFAGLVAKRVIFGVEGRTHQTWQAFVQALEAHNGHRYAITQVSTDMSAAYEKGVKENCRNAQVVFDKFHVLANAGKRVDQVRRAEVRLGGQGVWQAPHKIQWLWRFSPICQMEDGNCCLAFKEPHFHAAHLPHNSGTGNGFVPGGQHRPVRKPWSIPCCDLPP